MRRYGAKPSTPARLKGHNSTAKVHNFPPHFVGFFFDGGLHSFFVAPFVASSHSYFFTQMTPAKKLVPTPSSSRIVSRVVSSKIPRFSHSQQSPLYEGWSACLRCKIMAANNEFCLRQVPWQRCALLGQGGWRRERALGLEANPRPRYFPH